MAELKKATRAASPAGPLRYSNIPGARELAALKQRSHFFRDILCGSVGRPSAGSTGSYSVASYTTEI